MALLIPGPAPSPTNCKASNTSCIRKEDEFKKSLMFVFPSTLAELAGITTGTVNAQAEQAAVSQLPANVIRQNGWNGLPARLRRQLAAAATGGLAARRHRRAACSTLAALS
jgi:hypothetical protein